MGAAEVKESKAEAKAASVSGEAPPTNSPDYWRWKQMQDIINKQDFQYRDARADATRLVCAALDNDCLALGSAKGKKLDILLGMIEMTTTQLLEARNG